MNRIKIALLGCMVLSQSLYAQDAFAYQQQIQKISHQLHEAQKSHDYAQIEQLIKEFKCLLEQVLNERLMTNDQNQDKKWTTMQLIGVVSLSIICTSVIAGTVGFGSYVMSIGNVFNP